MLVVLGAMTMKLCVTADFEGRFAPRDVERGDQVAGIVFLYRAAAE